MDTSGINQVVGLPTTTSSTTPQPASQGSGPAFSQVIGELLNGTEVRQQDVELQLNQILTGDSSGFHDVSIAVAKADLAFRFVMQIRDQLIGTYREVMKMQI